MGPGTLNPDDLTCRLSKVGLGNDLRAVVIGCIFRQMECAGLILRPAIALVNPEHAPVGALARTRSRPYFAARPEAFTSTFDMMTGAASAPGLMPMVVVISRNVEQRYRGFLGSIILELSAGVYAQPHMNAVVRQRIWHVLSDWHGHLRSGSIVITWLDGSADGGLGLSVLGEPPKSIVAHGALSLVRRSLRQNQISS